MKNKLPFLVILLLLFANEAMAQCPKYTYNYDAAGNRIQRGYTAVCPTARTAKLDSMLIDSLFAIAQQEDIILPNTPTEELQKQVDENGLLMAELKNVYPNPTKGNFVVQFSNAIQNGNLQLYSIKGELLHNMTLNGTEFQIDISLLPSATYILNIKLDSGKLYNKTIIKL